MEGTDTLTALAELAAGVVEHMDMMEGIAMTPTLSEGQSELTDYPTTPTTIREPAPEDAAELGEIRRPQPPR